MENFKIVLLISAMSLGACTEPMDRSYVTDGPRNAMFSQDLKGCKELAANYRPDARGNGALIGAASGAVFGALDNEDDVAEGALVGAGVGAIAGVAAAQDDLNVEKRHVVIRCLQNRGHNVVG
ncbi:YMGG-like glycine zipper-containing protein [uncultured Pelagimonas sp.]|uniref:YMGG-like glycine zipper-containing protein n=1 Tax=uncultured Pelagimonas sp. TaxID=1618102 RepID=UPI002620C52D|nr:YMGG-like glycine zipper-containing protein [uncultured Pelagimonas sp.]